jgi:hypothetical protein
MEHSEFYARVGDGRFLYVVDSLPVCRESHTLRSPTAAMVNAWFDGIN